MRLGACRAWLCWQAQPPQPAPLHHVLFGKPAAWHLVGGGGGVPPCTVCSRAAEGHPRPPFLLHFTPLLPQACQTSWCGVLFHAMSMHSDFKANADPDRRASYNRHYAFKGRGRKEILRSDMKEDVNELVPTTVSGAGRGGSGGGRVGHACMRVHAAL